MELSDYNIMFMHIKGKYNILEDTMSRLKMLNIYKQLLEDSKVQVVNNMQQVMTEVCATSVHTIGNDMLHIKQR